MLAASNPCRAAGLGEISQLQRRQRLIISVNTTYHSSILAESSSTRSRCAGGAAMLTSIKKWTKCCLKMTSRGPRAAVGMGGPRRSVYRCQGPGPRRATAARRLHARRRSGRRSVWPRRGELDGWIGGAPARRRLCAVGECGRGLAGAAAHGRTRRQRSFSHPTSGPRPGAPVPEPGTRGRRAPPGRPRHAGRLKGG